MKNEEYWIGPVDKYVAIQENGYISYLPSLDSDTCHGIVDVDVLDCNVGHASFSIVPTEPSNANPVTRTAVNVVDFDIGASCLDGNAVIPCDFLTLSSSAEKYTYVILACDGCLSSSVAAFLVWWSYSKGQVDVMNGNTPGVLQVYSVGVEAVARGIDGHVEDLDSLTVIELEMALWAVLNYYSCDRHIVAAIES